MTVPTRYEKGWKELQDEKKGSCLGMILVPLALFLTPLVVGLIRLA